MTPGEQAFGKDNARHFGKKSCLDNASDHDLPLTSAVYNGRHWDEAVRGRFLRAKTAKSWHSRTVGRLHRVLRDR